MAPSAQGGVDWNPSAYNPDTHYAYFCAADSDFAIQAIPAAKLNADYLAGKSLAGVNFAGITFNQGYISAMDVTTNKNVWRVKWPRTCYSGIFTTAGGLVFAGRGTGEGLQLALNVGAMLISFVALIALVNAILGVAGLSLQQIFGWVFAPIAWSLGVPWRDAAVIGNLLGTRMVLNEFIAFAQLGPLKETLDPRSFTIATFALCGFANFSSIGIQIGGIGALVPSRRHDLARLGLRAMIAGTLANFLTAIIVGFLL